MRLVVFCIFCSVTVFGQISINQDDMPMPGDVFTYSIGSTSNEEPELTGENYTWNFMDLTMITQDSDSFVSVGETPFLYQFFFNNGLLYPDHHADVALAGDDMDLFTVSATNTYNYYKNNEEGYRLVGNGAEINGVPQSVQYNPIEWIYEFPLNYGDDFDGESYIEFTLPGFGFVSQEKDISTVVDGWGTLSIPIGNFEVLRIKKTINALDSAYSEIIGTGFLIPAPEEIKYQWLAAGETEPVLDISVIGGVITSARYKDEIISSIQEFSKEQINLYPNPAANIIQVTISDGSFQGNIKVIDATGQILPCAVIKEKNIYSINIESLASGLYFLQLEENGIGHTERFVIQ